MKKKNRYKYLLLVFLIPLFTGHTEDDFYKVEVLRNELVFTTSPFKACHASTIVELSNQRLMAAWFGGSYEGASDVGIWASVFEKNQWNKPVEVITSAYNDTSFVPCWNPVLFKLRNGRLILFYKQGKSPREWWGAVKTSDDDGGSWSATQNLPKGFLGPIKNKPTQLSDGTILCPSSTESLEKNLWKAHVEITNEDLKNWKYVPVDSSNERFGVIQPALLLHPQGKLQMLCRSRENRIVQSWSTDQGRHWSELSETSLPNPNSGIDGVTLLNGLHLVVYNPLLKGKEWVNGRNVLTVAASKDGIHWHDVYVLENEKDGEFSYPAIIQSSDENVHITYTSNRKVIKHVELSITTL